jgi:hypothetical protein
MGTGLFAIVKTAQAAENLINMMIWYSQAMNEQVPNMTYELAYIPNVGF